MPEDWNWKSVVQFGMKNLVGEAGFGLDLVGVLIEWLGGRLELVGVLIEWWGGWKS